MSTFKVKFSGRKYGETTKFNILEMEYDKPYYSLRTVAKDILSEFEYVTSIKIDSKSYTFDELVELSKS